MSAALEARLSTTSEGLWLAAALAGITRLPAVLKVRPVGDVDNISSHPGIAVLDAAGVSHNGVLDPDVAEWVITLGRPDIEVDVTITTAASAGNRISGPPPMFTAPDDPLEAHTALTEWAAKRPMQRVAALCRRDGCWVSAARVWQAGNADAAESDSQDCDEIVISPLGQSAAVSAAVNDLMGTAPAAQFHGVSMEADVLDSVVTQWQSDPDTNIVGVLADAGMTPEQARIVEVVGDATTARATIAALEHHVEGAVVGARAVMVADTLLGRVLVSSAAGSDGQVWTMLTPGTRERIAAALDEALESLPSATGWPTHQRARN